MLTVADMGEGGVKNGQKSADVLYGRPQRRSIDSWHLHLFHVANPHLLTCDGVFVILYVVY